jgi:hypothetical protein
MITRTRRKSLDYKDMVKTIEDTAEQDEEDPIIKLTLLDREDQMEKGKEGKHIFKERGSRNDKENC